MFVDEKRLGEAPVRQLGLADFISWLETQDPKDTYDFMDCEGSCLVGLYLAARGIPWRYGTMDSDIYMECSGHETTHIASRLPYTFGAALGRARKVLANS